VAAGGQWQLDKSAALVAVDSLAVEGEHGIVGSLAAWQQHGINGGSTTAGSAVAARWQRWQRQQRQIAGSAVG
jgi:hypothetical protein